MTSGKDARDRNKKICINCLARNYLIECSCGCGNVIFMISKKGLENKYYKNHRQNLNKGKPSLNYKGGSIAKGYWKIYVNGKRIKRSHHVYEQYHKCSLLPYAVIHHIDGNKLNDDPLNLKGYSSNVTHRQENHSSKTFISKNS